MARNDSFNTVFGLIFVGGGLIYDGLKGIKLRRRMLDTPTSKIASAAIGSSVEVVGTLLCTSEEAIESPLTRTMGYGFIWSLEQLIGNGKRKRWVPLHTYYSTPFIYIQDSSNAVAAIDIAACEFPDDVFQHTTEFCDRNFDLPPGVKAILDDAGMLNTKEKRSILTSSNYRLRERMFKLHEKFYVLGTAHAPPKKERTTIPIDNHVFGKRKINVHQKIFSLFNKLKGSPRQIKEFDRDGDGQLNGEESQLLYKSIEGKLLDKFAQSNTDYLSQTRIFFSQDENPEAGIKLKKVFLSNKSEKNTATALAQKNYLFLIAGPILIVLGVLLGVIEIYD